MVVDSQSGGLLGNSPKVAVGGVFESISSVVACLLLVVACLYYLGQHKLTMEEIPQGDFAADLLLESRIDDQGALWLGHYSRFEFNHPGPFYFYVTHAMHVFMEPMGFPISGAAYAASLLVNGAFLVLVACLSLAIWRIPLSFPALLVVSLLVISMVGADIVSTWMPSRMILPYLAFFLLMILLLQRRFIFFPIACFTIGILVHSYLSMVVMAIPLFVAISLYYFSTNQWRISSQDKILLLLGGVIALVFMSPIMIDSIVSEKSNVAAILVAMKRDHEKMRWINLLTVTNEVVRTRLSVLHLCILLFGMQLIAANYARLGRTWNHVLVLALLVFVAYMLYHKTVPAPMYKYMVLFFTALPIAVIVLAAITVFSDAITLSGFKQRALQSAVILLAITSVAHFRPLQTDANNGKAIRAIAQAMVPDGKQRDTVAINYVRHDQWQVIAALLFELHQRGVPACNTRQKMAFLYTPEKTCSKGTEADYRIVPAEACKGECTLRRDGIGLISLK